MIDLPHVSDFTPGDLFRIGRGAQAHSSLAPFFSSAKSCLHGRRDELVGPGGLLLWVVSGDHMLVPMHAARDQLTPNCRDGTSAERLQKRSRRLSSGGRGYVFLFVVDTPRSEAASLGFLRNYLLH